MMLEFAFASFDRDFLPSLVSCQPSPSAPPLSLLPRISSTSLSKTGSFELLHSLL